MALITSNAVPPGTVASVFGHNFEYVNLRGGIAGLPQVIAILATFDPLKTAVVANKPVRVFTEVEAGEKFGFGSPAHLAARQVLRKSGIVPVFIFPITETGTASTGEFLFSITSTSAGTQTYYIGGQKLQVVIPDATAPAAAAALVNAAINADINLPITSVVDGGTAEQLNFTGKFKGLIGDGITLALNLTEAEKDAAPGGTAVAITDMASGAGVPTITDALDEMGSDWYTYVINTFGPDSTTMAALATFNEDERWDPLVNKFFRAFYGSVADFATITAITDALPLDKTNGVVTSPGGYMLPLELAALAVGQMAASNQIDPALPYSTLELDGLVPASSASQWKHTVRNAAIEAGTGTTILEDNVIKLEDIVMHYHKTGEVPPAFRWAVDIAKLAQWAYSVNLIFTGPVWKPSILVPDDAIVDNPNARRPKDAIAEIFRLIDIFSRAAITVRPDITKENTGASIDGSNPNRLNINTLIVLSGAGRIIALTSKFGFNFGALSV